jgi:hypothetical protein
MKMLSSKGFLMKKNRGAPRKGEQVRMRVTRSFSSELIIALEAITTNQSEFVENWMWEHPLLREKKPKMHSAERAHATRA